MNFNLLLIYFYLGTFELQIVFLFIIGLSDVYESSWYAFKSMQFLWDKNQVRETQSTVSIKLSTTYNYLATKVDDYFESTLLIRL